MLKPNKFCATYINNTFLHIFIYIWVNRWEIRMDMYISSASKMEVVKQIHFQKPKHAILMTVLMYNMYLMMLNKNIDTIQAQMIIFIFIGTRILNKCYSNSYFVFCGGIIDNVYYVCFVLIAEMPNESTTQNDIYSCLTTCKR